MALSEYNQDFAYTQNGTYHDRNLVPSRGIVLRKAIKRSSGHGTICPSCGIARSRSNKCECNS